MTLIKTSRKFDDSIDDLFINGRNLIAFYRANPCIAAYDLLGVDLAPIQRVVFEDMWFKNYTITVATRGFGKSFLLGLASALSSLLYPGFRVGLIGPVYRQSQLIFAEVEKLYNKSSIFREAVEKKPTRGPASCYVRFKAVGGYNGSYIEALPLGTDGGKIRGSRFYLICIDELAQVPDRIVDMVIRPFAATTLEPMQNVRRLERKNRLISLGLATEEDFEDSRVNKMLMTSSGYYKFNHMWRRMRDHWTQMEKEGDKSQYVVHQVPYTLLPDGFLDKNNIKEAKRVMSSHEYRMEYEAAMISDSEGFFKASLLEECTSGSEFNIELKGDPRCEYIIGIDPNQGGATSCGVVIVKLGNVNQVVNVLELRNKTTQGLTTFIQKVCVEYNILRIFMDAGGGGKAICDLLEDGYNDNVPIINRNDESHRHMEGRHILDLVNFSPSWISDANFTALSLMETKKMRFPEPPITSIEHLDALAYERINKLKSQMLSIIVTQTSSGLMHFDTPTKSMNKDLYSAFILVSYGIKEVSLPEDEVAKVYSSGGVMRERHSSNGWFSTVNKTPQNSMSKYAAAILKRRIK